MTTDVMKVILDIESVHGNLTGIGRYSLELARGLPDAAENEVLYWNGFSFQGDVVCGGTEEIREVSTVGFLRRILHNRITRFAWSLLPSSIKEWKAIILRHLNKRRILQDLERHSDHVFHGPNFFLPKFSGKKIVTVHDMSVFRFPEYHPEDRVKFMSREVPKALAEADGVIAISEFTRKELIHYFPLVEDKVHVVPNGANKPESLDFSDLDVRVIEELDLVRGGFFLCVSTVEPRKNLSTLLNAYQRLPGSLRAQFPLVLVGGNGWKSGDLMARIRSARHANVRYLGYVEEKVLAALYKSAKAFVFPSLYEGFGLPAIEAMAHGLPVVCAKSTAVAEVCDGNALEFQGDSWVELTEHLRRLIVDVDLAEELSKASLRQAEKYSWDRCCKETYAVYKSVIGNNR